MVESGVSLRTNVKQSRKLGYGLPRLMARNDGEEGGAMTVGRGGMVESGVSLRTNVKQSRMGNMDCHAYGSQ